MFAYLTALSNGIRAMLSRPFNTLLRRASNSNGAEPPSPVRSSYMQRLSSARLIQQQARQDIIAFLGTSFASPALLLNTMFDCNAILSGSRALDWIIPGSCDSSSDWDFYVAPNDVGIGRLITVFQHCGVVFESVWDPLLKIASRQGSNSVRLPKYQLYAWLEHRKHVATPGLVEQLLDEIVSKPFENGVIQLNNGTTLDLFDVAPDGQYGPALNIIRGYTTHNDVYQSVQVMFKAGRTPIDHIMAFYSSHVQCGITGFGAFHLSFEMASQKKGVIWLRNSQHRASVDTALQKYADRGWTFEVSAACTSPVLKRGFEFLYWFENLPFVMEPTVLESRKAALNDFSWMQARGKTTHIPSLSRVNEAVFAARSFRREHSSVDDREQDVTDRLTALQHTTAVTHTKEPRPDETLGI